MARVTASFLLQGECITKIGTLLRDEQHGWRNDIVRWIGKLQTLEKTKLDLTAALHLEKIREQTGLVDDGGLGTVTKLLQEGVHTLEKKVTQRVEEINDVLEELRYAAFEVSNENDEH